MSNYVYLLGSFGALVFSFVFTGLVRQWALSHRIVSIPRGGRDLHQKPIPRLGGVAIGLSLLVILIVIYIFFPEALNFTQERRISIDRSFLGILIGGIIILIAGIVDDLKDWTPGKQLFWQFMAIGSVIASGIGINFVRSPWGIIPLDQWTWHIVTIGQYSVTITLWSDLLTIFWLIVIMNVINWLDGLDGLASGVSAIAALMLFILSLMVGGSVATAVLSSVLLGSVLGFIPWNWQPAKIFMGSSGSYLIGFILGVIAIVSGGKMATAILVLGLPVFDALWVATRRILSGKSPFRGDRRHLHHRLIDAGFSVKQSVFLIYTVALTFGVLALFDATAQGKFVLIIWALAVLVVIGALTLMLEKKNTKN